MLVLLRLLLVLCAAFSFAAPAAAQQDAAKNKSKLREYTPYSAPAPRPGREGADANTRPYYEWMTRQALAYQPKTFDFGTFRKYYAKTDQYDPFGDVRKEMMDIVYKAKFAEDPAQKKKYFDEYAALLTKHMANMDVITQAQVLCEDDPRFGDAKFFKWMRAGLLKSVLNSGDGASLYRAYDIITMGEETALFKALPLDMLSVQTEESGGSYYNMHSVQDAAHTKPYTIFVNVTVPMRWLDEKKRMRQGVFDVHRQ